MSKINRKYKVRVAVYPCWDGERDFWNEPDNAPIVRTFDDEDCAIDYCWEVADRIGAVYSAGEWYGPLESKVRISNRVFAPIVNENTSVPTRIRLLIW